MLMNVGRKSFECCSRSSKPEVALISLANIRNFRLILFSILILQHVFSIPLSLELTAFCFRSIIDQYFGGRFTCELKCTESEEPVTVSEENFLQLSCFISQEVKYMHSGLLSVSSK